MREIKFRAWNSNTKKMTDEFLIIPNTGKALQWYDEGNTGWVLEHFEVMQFTGLHDKNGKEIYEGDICLGHSDGSGKIVWQEDAYVYEFDDENVVNLWEAKPLIVIGNIYENPDLLTKEDKGV